MESMSVTAISRMKVALKKKPFKPGATVTQTSQFQQLTQVRLVRNSLVFGLDLNFDLFQHPYFHSAATSCRPSVNMIVHA